MVACARRERPVRRTSQNGGKALLTLWSEDDSALEFRVSTVRNYSIWAAILRGLPSALRAGSALGRLRSGLPQNARGA
jgi:hypothetical protein